MTAFEDAARELSALVLRVEQLESQLRTIREQTGRHDGLPRTAYTVSEVAARIGKHPQTVRNMIADGRLEAEDMGGWYAVPASVVDALAVGRVAS